MSSKSPNKLDELKLVKIHTIVKMGFDDDKIGINKPSIFFREISPVVLV